MIMIHKPINRVIIKVFFMPNTKNVCGVARGIIKTVKPNNAKPVPRSMLPIHNLEIVKNTADTKMKINEIIIPTIKNGLDRSRNRKEVCVLFTHSLLQQSTNSLSLPAVIE